MALDGSGNGDDFSVGSFFSIKTTLGDEFQGQVITFDRPSNILVLHILSPFLIFLFVFLFFLNSLTVSFFCCYFCDLIQEGSKPGPRRNIRLLKANYIKEFSFLGHGEDPLDLKNCYLDLNTLRAREELAIRFLFFNNLLSFSIFGRCFNWFDFFSGKLRPKRRG